jgi:hypothetical protein
MTIWVCPLHDARVALEKSADVSELRGRLRVCGAENDNMFQFNKTKDGKAPAQRQAPLGGAHQVNGRFGFRLKKRRWIPTLR